MIFSYTVSNPTITIASSPRDQYIAGSEVVLICTIVLGEAVNVPVSVYVTWRNSGYVITSESTGVAVSNVTMENSLTFQASVTLNPLSRIQHSGVYSCTVGVKAKQSYSNVLETTSSAEKTVTVESKD